MAEFQFTRKAVEDLDSVWDYTADRWSEEQAEKYYRMLISACRKVADNPLLVGRKYEEVAEGLWGFKTGRHLIFYRIIEEKKVEIVRILHECMELKNKIGK